MARPPEARNFYSVDLTAALTGEPTPEATSGLLRSADAWPVDVATAPYCGCGHIFDGLSAAGLNDRFFAVMVAPGAVHARAAISRGWTDVIDATNTYHELWTTDGGTTGNDVVRVPGHLVASLNYAPTAVFRYGSSSIAVSAGGVNDSPTQPTDRALELQTTGAPYVEAMYVSKAAGISVVVNDQLADLETL